MKAKKVKPLKHTAAGKTTIRCLGCGEELALKHFSPAWQRRGSGWCLKTANACNSKRNAAWNKAKREAAKGATAHA